MRADLPLLGGMTIIVVLFPVSNAWAYLDAGTGSFILQMLLGGAAGVLMMVRLYWQKLKLAIGRTFHRRPSGEESEKPR